MTEKEMIQKIKKQEDDGLSCLIAQYGQYVASVIYDISGCEKEDAEEMAVEVFVSFWKYAKYFDENRSLKHWLQETARNIARYQKNVKKVGEIPLELLGEIAVGQDEWEQAVSEQKENDREMFLSYYNKNEKIIETAEKYSLSKRAVKMKLHRIRKQIQKILQKGGCKR